MSASSVSTRSAVDGPHPAPLAASRPHLRVQLDTGIPVYVSDSSSTGAIKEQSQHCDSDETDNDGHEQAEIEAAEVEMREDQERDAQLQRDRSTGVAGWIGRWLPRPRRRKKPPPRLDARAQPGETDVVGPETRLLPLLSGLSCPFAVLLDVPGLTTPWYIRTDGDVIIASERNPVLLDVGQAVALAFGVLANAALIWRFLEHRPRLTTWVATLSLTVHDAIAIASVTWFGVVHRFNDGFTYSDGFWMTVAACVASVVCNFTLAFDLVRTKHFDEKGSGLTEKQRALVIVCMSFLLLIGFGSLCNSYLIPDLRFVDAMYYTECLATSVGFGDIVPRSTGAKIFTIFYAPLGIINLAVLIAIARETIIESFEASYRARRDRLAAKARERKEAIRKKQELARERKRRVEEERAHGDPAASTEASAQGAFVPPVGRSALVAGLGASMPVAGAIAETDAARARLPTLSALERIESTTPSRIRRLQTFLTPFGWIGQRLLVCVFGRRHASAASDCDCEAAPSSEPGPGHMQRTSTMSSSITTTSIEQSFTTLRQELLREQRQEFRVKLTVALTVFLLFWLVGAAVYSVTEDGWSFWTGIYFSFIYFTTLGLGDYTPKSPAGRAFFVAWALFGIASMTLLLSVLTESWSARYKSSLTDGRFKKAYRRMTVKQDGRGNSHEETPQEITDRLFERDGYSPLTRSGQGPPATVDELPEKIIKAIKAFHSHARYFMLARNGHPPAQLRALLAAAEDQPDGVDQLIQRGAASLAEAGAQGDTEHFLFLVSYERQIDLLLESAEQLANVVGEATARISRLEADNARLEEEVARLGEQETMSETGLFQTRPPGGFGDEEAEEALCEETDGTTKPTDTRGDHGDTPEGLSPHVESTSLVTRPTSPPAVVQLRTRTPSVAFAPDPR